jgi:hypothetical protein
VGKSKLQKEANLRNQSRIAASQYGEGGKPEEKDLAEMFIPANTNQRSLFCS